MFSLKVAIKRALRNKLILDFVISSNRCKFEMNIKGWRRQRRQPEASYSLKLGFPFFHFGTFSIVKSCVNSA